MNTELFTLHLRDVLALLVIPLSVVLLGIGLRLALRRDKPWDRD